MTPRERFEDKYIPDPNSGCWIWTAARHHKLGYGQFRYNGQMRPAHKVIWEWENGPVPDGLELDHKCRVRCCVNPNHLEPVTHRENVLRGDSFMAKRAKATHCKHGHPFSGDNLIIRPDGRTRRCRECSRAAIARYKKRNIDEVRKRSREYMRRKRAKNQ